MLTVIWHATDNIHIILPFLYSPPVDGCIKIGKVKFHNYFTTDTIESNLTITRDIQLL